ncbi:hypothetical protein D3C85_1111920 [compost metagenome]
MPMPPCSWMPWPQTNFAARPISILAPDRVLRRVGSSSLAMDASATCSIERASSSSAAMSAMRCCKAWNEPMGTPNCLRIFRYSAVASRVFSMPPISSAQSATMPWDRPSRSAGKPCPASPSSASAATATPSKLSSSAQLPSCRGSAWRSSPGLSASTSSRLMPAVPAIRAETMKARAPAAPSTRLLRPYRRKPSPLRSARSVTGSGMPREPGSL